LRRDHRLEHHEELVMSVLRLSEWEDDPDAPRTGWRWIVERGLGPPGLGLEGEGLIVEGEGGGEGADADEDDDDLETYHDDESEGSASG
jgi:hypothetical protein